MLEERLLQPLLFDEGQDDEEEVEGPLGEFAGAFGDGLVDFVMLAELQGRFAHDVKLGIFLNISVILFFVLDPQQLLFNVPAL